MVIITLTTDFGLTDAYVGAVKGALLSIAPQTALVDITHLVPPQDILAGSLCLEAAAPYFPRGSIHLAVVDPGVGTERKAVVVETENAFYVAPDNGLLTLPLRTDPPLRIVALNGRADRYALPSRSRTFHGRDLFAPIAAHLAQGLPLEELGEVYSAALYPLVELAVPEPVEAVLPEGGAALICPIIAADRFGNLTTSLHRSRYKEWLPLHSGSFTAQAGTLQFSEILETYGSAAEGIPLLLWGSGGRLELAVRNGSALAELKLDRGSLITIALRKELCS